MKVLKLENIFVKDPGWGCLYDEKKDSTYIYKTIGSWFEFFFPLLGWVIPHQIYEISKEEYGKLSISNDRYKGGKTSFGISILGGFVGMEIGNYVRIISSKTLGIISIVFAIVVSVLFKYIFFMKKGKNMSYKKKYKVYIIPSSVKQIIKSLLLTCFIFIAIYSTISLLLSGQFTLIFAIGLTLFLTFYFFSFAILYENHQYYYVLLRS